MDEQLHFENQDKEPSLYVQRIKVIAIREESTHDSYYMHSPESVYELPFLRDELLSSDREMFICLHLNIKHKLVAWEVISIGSLNYSVVHPREVFKGALLANAASVILCHNHPSGNPDPSPEDITVTKRLEESGKILGIEVLDHIIFGENGFVSLKEIGIL